MCTEPFIRGGILLTGEASEQYVQVPQHCKALTYLKSHRKSQAKLADNICDETVGPHSHPLRVPGGDLYIACCKAQSTLAQAIEWSCMPMQAASLSTSLSAVASRDFSEAGPKNTAIDARSYNNVHLHINFVGTSSLPSQSISPS